MTPNVVDNAEVVGQMRRQLGLHRVRTLTQHAAYQNKWLPFAGAIVRD
jgi:hypothetical protein